VVPMNPEATYVQDKSIPDQTLTTHLAPAGVLAGKIKGNEKAKPWDLQIAPLKYYAESDCMGHAISPTWLSNCTFQMKRCVATSSRWSTAALYSKCTVASSCRTASANCRSRNACTRTRHLNKI